MKLLDASRRGISEESLLTRCKQRGTNLRENRLLIDGKEWLFKENILLYFQLFQYSDKQNITLIFS